MQFVWTLTLMLILQRSPFFTEREQKNSLINDVHAKQNLLSFFEKVRKNVMRYLIFFY